MGETRKEKRRKTFAFFGVNDQKTNNFVGWIVNMTSEGVRLRSLANLELDALFLFKIDLPFEIDNSKEILFEAKSVWSKQIDDKNEFSTGFMLQDVAPDEISKIKQLIESSQFEDGDEQIPVTLSKMSN